MIRPAFLLAVLFLAAPAMSDTTIPVADAQRGAFVTVAGTVDRILDEDTFRLADASGSIRVYIGPNPMPVRGGDTVTVSGQVDDDLIGPKEIYADEMVLADGTTVALPRRYD